jgi:type I restriction enzyme S subunit
MNMNESVSFAYAPFDIIDGDRGKNYPKQGDFTDTGHCVFLSATNVTKTGFDFSSCQFINEKRDAMMNKGKLQREDIVLTTRGTIGNTAYFNDAVPFDHLRINSGMVILRCDRTKLLPAFLYHFVRSPTFFSQVNSLRSGAAQPQLPIRDMRHINLPLPHLPVQRHIAGILSAYDELIENSQRRIKILESMARSLYREWFVHFRFPGHESVPLVASSLGEIPKGWDVRPFTDTADVLSGGTPKTDVADYWDGDIPFFTPRDAPGCFYVNDCDKHVTDLGLSKCAGSLYPPDTVFITARGTVGKVALPSVPMAMNQSCYALQGKLAISQRYLFLLTLQQVDYLKTNTGGATFDTIVVDTFRRMQIVIPPRAVIADFDTRVHAIFDEVNTLQRQIQNLRRTRDLLLPRLLSGQIDVEAKPA